MSFLEFPYLFIIGGAALFMAAALLRGVTAGGYVQAQVIIDARRIVESREREANAEAEAAGRAAEREPIHVYPDGSPESPIIGMVENKL